MTLGVSHLVLAIQIASASVSGTVRDGMSGTAVGGAVVSLHDLERTTVTDANGRYLFRDVPPGPQHVVVRRIGYAPRTLHALVPAEGSVAIDIALRAHPITLEVIEARSAIPVRGLDDADSTALPDRSVSMAALRHHPLLAEADAFEALDGGAVATRPESPSGLHVRGGAADQVAYLLDGIPVFSPYHTAGSFSAWNPDALAALRLHAAAPGLADALSGVVSARIREPGSEVVTQGSLSTTQARLTIDGPLWRGGGYLLGHRVGFAGFPKPERESSHLRGETGDWIAKLESPLAGGRFRVLGFESESEVGAAAVAEDSAGVLGPRNEFAWRSGSAGGEWTRRLRGGGFGVRAWSARSAAAVTWRAPDSTLEYLTAGRSDIGLTITVDVAARGRHTVAGVRSERSRTSYRVRPAADSGRAVELGGLTGVSAAFVQHSHDVTRRTGLELSLVAALAAGNPYLSPRAAVRWAAGPAVAVRAEYGRLHQFAQSLRNPESVVGMIFPVDLHLGAGAVGVPVARSDQAIVAAEYRPRAGVRAGAQIYARDFEGLVIVAPHDASPFAARFTVGSGVARGGAVELDVNGARYGFLAGYGVQYVSFEYGDTSFVPDHGAVHSIDGGVTLFPSATFSVRLGASALWGRRTTALGGPLEFEPCNLINRGCEFAGSPQERREPLGATALPAYFRVDLGLRKHWHFKVAGRDRMVAVFGTVTNILGHRNVLTVASDPATGARTAIGMRPRAILVAGIDWRF